MVDVSYSGTLDARPAKAAPMRLPAPQPMAVPVFIHDCVTPLGGETLLSLLMKRMQARADADELP